MGQVYIHAAFSKCTVLTKGVFAAINKRMAYKVSVQPSQSNLVRLGIYISLYSNDDPSPPPPSSQTNNIAVVTYYTIFLQSVCKKSPSELDHLLYQCKKT